MAACGAATADHTDVDASAADVKLGLAPILGCGLSGLGGVGEQASSLTESFPSLMKLPRLSKVHATAPSDTTDAPGSASVSGDTFLMICQVKCVRKA